MDMTDGSQTDPAAIAAAGGAGGGGASGANASTPALGGGLDPRLQAMIMAARYHGVELDPGEFRLGQGEAEPTRRRRCRSGRRTPACGRAPCGCAGAI